jgi:hypothetical protein
VEDVMSLTRAELRSVQRERLRAVLALLEFTPPGPRHDQLLEQTRAIVASLRASQAAPEHVLVASRARPGAPASRRLTA